MKNSLASIVLLGLVVLAGCSGDSPSQPPVPTPAVDTWAITLTASPSSAAVGQFVFVDANVTMNGGSAPDGTTIEFLCSAPAFFSSGGAYVTYNEIVTEGGVATTAFASTEAGTFTVQARTHAVVRQTNVTFSQPGDDNLEIFLPPAPSAGDRNGGEQVILNGKGIVAPIEVFFKVTNTAGLEVEHQAVTLSVDESIPLHTDGSVIIVTPPITNILNENVDLLADFVADMRVVRGFGTADEMEAIYPQAFTFPSADNPENLQIFYPLVPEEGQREGLETVVLNGKAIVSPVEVYFTPVAPTDAGDDPCVFTSLEYQGQVTDVVPSAPLAATGSITVVTPPFYNVMQGSDACVGESIPVDVRVLAGVGAGDPLEQEIILPLSFEIIPQGVYEGTPEPWIYVLLPDQGSPRGGETVTIIGRGFDYETTNPDTVEVELECSGVNNLLGIEPVVSPDETQIQFITPQFSATPLTSDVVCDVKVTNLLGGGGSEFEFTKDDAYVYLAEEPDPEITALAPTSGPVDGGTVVTIFGSGFQVPVQVMFGTLEAIVTEVNDDTSLLDHDTIICVAPDQSALDLVPPFTVNVTVTNILTGNTDTATAAYTYGEGLFISGNTPVLGGPGTEVVIYGTGFEDPLTIDFTGFNPPLRLETQAVSGTQVVARFPTDADPRCSETSGQFLITLVERPYIEGEGYVQGGGFLFLGQTPIVVSVDPDIVQETMLGAGVSPNNVTVYGHSFTPTVLVAFDTYIFPSGDVLVVNDEQIDLFNIPAPNDFNLAWNNASCLTDLGQAGIRRVATPVDVTVTNIPEECEDTLRGAIVYEPETSDCVVAPDIEVATLVFEDTPAGSCSVGTTLAISNAGAADLTITSLQLFGRFFFDAGATTQAAAGFVIPAFGFDTSLTVYFCPDQDNNATYSGQLVIISDDPDENPYTQALSGDELAEAVLLTSPYGDGDTWNFAAFPGLTEQLDLTIQNSAAAQDNLNWTAAVAGTSAPRFTIISAASGSLAPGATATLTVQFAPLGTDVSGSSFPDTLTVTGTNATSGLPATNSPIAINLNGNVL